MTTHLTPITSPRGFDRLPELHGTDPGDSIEVSESSAAFTPHIWLGVKAMHTPMDAHGNILGPAVPVEANVHLTAETARQLAEQLLYLIEHHYQGTASTDVD